MNGLNKTGEILNRIVKVLFVVLMACVLFATVVIDRNIDNMYPNTVIYDNGGYYLGALILLCGLFYALYIRPNRHKSAKIKRGKGMTARRYYCILAVIALVVAALQYIISQWVPLQTEYFRNDFKQTMAGAWDLAHGGTLEGYKYFKTSPNNVNITIVLSLVYRLFPTVRSVIWISALLTNASVVLTSLSVYNVTKREGLALMVAVLGEVLMGLTWRSFVVYTDNYGMFFAALMLWIYTTQIKPEIKVPLIVLFAVCGTYIKMTHLVLFVAFAAYGLVKWLKSDGHRLNYRRMAIYTGCTVALFGLMFGLQTPIRESYGFVPGKYPKGWQYLFMVGQDDETIGTAGGSNGTIRKQLIRQFRDINMVNDAMLQEGINRINNRGIAGNISFYEKKLVVAYNDGTFSINQPAKMFKMEKTFLYELYMLKGRYYQIGATVFQILWDAVLLVLIVYALWRVWRYRYRRQKGGFGRRNGQDSRGTEQPKGDYNIINLLIISILGVTLYLMLLEGRAKYLIMFLPVYLMAFGLMYHEICQRVGDMISSRSKM